jgi:hypothetical protein
VASAQKIFSRMDSVGQQRMAQARRAPDNSRSVPISGRRRSGARRAGTALVGDPQTVAARIKEYQEIGIILYRRATRILRKPIASPNWYSRCFAGAARQREADPRQYRTVRRNHRQRISPAETGLAIMNLIDSLPRSRAKTAAGRRLDP